MKTCARLDAGTETRAPKRISDSQKELVGRIQNSLRSERMTVSRRAVLLSSFLALLTLSCAAQVFAEAGEVEARAALDNVGVFVEKAFLAVVEAEEVGANVTGLKAALGYAGELLASGEADFRVGNFSGAVDFALLANESVKDVAADASLLSGGC